MFLKGRGSLVSTSFVLLFAVMKASTQGTQDVVIEPTGEISSGTLDQIQKAYDNFTSRMDEILLGREQEIGVLEAQVDQIEENTWVESINLWAQNLLVDGYPIVDLYPDCISEAKGSYSERQSRINLDLEVVSLDLCILSKPSVDVPSREDYSDPTVDALHPLGTTQVDYTPNVDAMTKLIRQASEDYRQLESTFESVKGHLSEEIGEARAEFVSALESISATLTVPSPDLDLENQSISYTQFALNSQSLLSLCDQLIQQALHDLDSRKKDIFKPDFPSQYEPFFKIQTVQLSLRHDKQNDQKYRKLAIQALFFTLSAIVLFIAIRYYDRKQKDQSQQQNEPLIGSNEYDHQRQPYSSFNGFTRVQQA